MKKITLDCYTYRPEVYKYSPISKSNNFLPDWWKSLPASQCPITGEMQGRLTMKSCPGFTDFFKYSYTLPLWSDLKLRASGNDWAYQFSDDTSEIKVHHRSQFEGFKPDSQHFKLQSPWKLFCNKPIKWAFVSPTWHDTKGVHILSGIVDYYYQHTSSVNMFLDKPNDIVLPLHTPLAHIIPMTEEKVEMKLHLVSEQEWIHLTSPNLTFTRWYYKMRRLMNERNS